MPLFISDPELVEHCGFSKLAKTPAYFFRREARLLRRIHKMRHNSGLGHHLGTQHVLNFARDFVGKPGAAR